MLSDIERYEYIINLLIKENKELKKENDELKHNIYQKKNHFDKDVNEDEDEKVNLENIFPFLNNDVDDDAETVNSDIYDDETVNLENDDDAETVNSDIYDDETVNLEDETYEAQIVNSEDETLPLVPLECENKKVKRDRSFDGYVKKYIPDGKELIMKYKKNNNIIEIKCVVDYKSSKFINEDGQYCKSLNMVFQNKCKKLGIKAEKECWKSFKMDGKSIDNLYE